MQIIKSRAVLKPVTGGSVVRASCLQYFTLACNQPIDKYFLHFGGTMDVKLAVLPALLRVCPKE